MCGGNRWSRPCLGRNATRRPVDLADETGSLGAPNGVSTLTSSAPVEELIEAGPADDPDVRGRPQGGREGVCRGESSHRGQATFSPAEPLEEEDDAEEDDDEEPAADFEDDAESDDAEDDEPLSPEAEALSPEAEPLSPEAEALSPDAGDALDDAAARLSVW